MLVCTLKRLIKTIFHSCGLLLCKFFATKESIHIRKQFNSHRDTNMTGVASCKKALLLYELVSFPQKMSVSHAKNKKLSTNYYIDNLGGEG